MEIVMKKSNKSGVAGSIGLSDGQVTKANGFSPDDVGGKNRGMTSKQYASSIGVADADDLALDAATRGDLPVSERNDGVLWEISDKYSRACAARILDQFTGQPTQFAMVYGWDGATSDAKPNGWTAVRPVSDRYKPLRTQDIVDIAVERLKGQPMMEEQIRTDRFGTSIEVKIPLDRPISLSGKPFDQGHPWTNHGTATNKDVVFPVVNLRNAYDATSSIVVDIGYYRLICSNGMKVILAGVGSRAIHTKHEVTRVIDEISKQDFKGDKQLIERLAIAKVTVKDAMRIFGTRVPEKWQKQLAEYAAVGNNTAWAWMNGLSYIATHEYSLLRSRQLEPVMTQLQNFALAA